MPIWLGWEPSARAPVYYRGMMVAIRKNASTSALSQGETAPDTALPGVPVACEKMRRPLLYNLATIFERFDVAKDHPEMTADFQHGSGSSSASVRGKRSIIEAPK